MYKLKVRVMHPKCYLNKNIQLSLAKCTWCKYKSALLLKQHFNVVAGAHFDFLIYWYTILNWPEKQNWSPIQIFFPVIGNYDKESHFWGGCSGHWFHWECFPANDAMSFIRQVQFPWHLLHNFFIDKKNPLCLKQMLQLFLTVQRILRKNFRLSIQALKFNT